MYSPRSKGLGGLLLLAVLGGGSLVSSGAHALQSSRPRRARHRLTAQRLPAVTAGLHTSAARALANFRISSGASRAASAGNDGFDFGDYAGLAFHGGVFYPAWADNSSVLPGNPDLPGAARFDLGAAPVTVSGTTPTVGTVANVTHLIGQQFQPAVAVDPTNPLNVVITSDNSQGGLVKSRSVDGGATWTTTVIADGADALDEALGDSSVTFDQFGNCFLVYRTPTDSGFNTCALAVSTDGGVTFTRRPTLGSDDVDPPTVVTGPGATGNDSVWVCFYDWNAAGGAGAVVAAGAPVTGLGTVGSFSSQSAPASPDAFAPDIAVGPNGQVMVAYQDAVNPEGPSALKAHLDANGLGAGGFGAAINLGSTNVGWIDFLPAQSQRAIDAEVGLAWDRSGGEQNNRVYLVYTDESTDESDNTDIYVRYSDNNGAAWSTPLKVSDDSSARSQFLPRIAMDQTTGNAAVTWYDCRRDTGSAGSTDTDGIANTDAELWGTIVNEPPDPTIRLQLSAATASVAEGSGNLTLSVTRTGDPSTPVGVSYATANGTAIAGSDYSAVSGTLSFAANEKSKTIGVPITLDNVLEPGETFQITLSNPTGGAILGSTTAATVTIADDTAATAPSNLVAIALSPTSIGLSWTDNCANETDFVLERKVGAGSFSPLASPSSPAYTDNSLTTGTLYTYRVRARKGALVSDFSPEASLRITTLQFAATSYSGAEGTGVTLTVTRNGGTTGSASATVQVVNGTATSGADLSAPAASLIVPAGQSSQSFQIDLAADALLEGSESFTVTLSNPGGSGVVLGSPAAATVTISDDGTVLAPTALTAAAQSTSRIDLAWVDHTGNESGFEVWRKSGSGAYQLLGTTGANATSYADTSVVAEVQYTYQVRAVAGAVKSSYSNEATAQIGLVSLSAAAYSVAEAVGAVMITVSRTGDTSTPATVSLTATDAGAVALADYTAPSAVSFGAGEASKSVSIPITDDNHLEASESFTVALGSPSAGLFLGTNTTATVTIADDTARIAPGSPSATVTGPNSITLSWSDRSDNETQFSLERQVGSGGFQALTTVAAGVTSLADTAVSPGVLYTYRVRATNGAHSSDFGVTEPVTITALQFDRASVLVGEGDTVSLTVTRSGDLSIPVSVAYATEGGSASSPDDFTAATGTLAFGAGEASKSFVVSVATDLLTEGTEQFQVRLSEPGGNGATLGTPDTLTVTISDEPVALPPTSLTATVVNATSIRLDWTTSSPVTTPFVVERQVGTGGSFVQLAVVGSGVLTYTDTAVLVDTDYVYRVRATNGGIQSDPSPTASARIPAGAKASVTPTRLNFGTLKVTAAPKRKTVKIKNAGKVALLGTVGIPTGAFRLVSGGGAFNLAPRQTRLVVVEFAPGAPGRSAGTLAITTTDPKKASVTISLQAAVH